MQLIDTSHSFYQVKWRRYCVVALPLVWAAVELYFGNVVWAGLSAAIGAYLVWHLILNFPPPTED